MMKIMLPILSLLTLTFMIEKKNWNMMIFNYIIFLTFMFIKNNMLFMNYYWTKINYIFSWDLISFSLTILTFWITSLSMYSNNLYMKNKKFIYIMMFLCFNLMMTFFSMNFMMFYIFFEVSLIPIILIIMGWGYQIDRIQASMYMLFYTLIGSLPLLIMIMFMNLNFNTIMMNILWMKNLNLMNSMFFFFILNMAFFIKMPMYLLHLWLPKAHVEAPVSGSMILAGIMLKLGSYGLYRSMIMFPSLMMKFNKYLIIISLMGSLISSLICLNQNDLKIIVAYSSVVHMSLMLASMLTLFKLSFKGSLLMMIAHGLCSSSLFYLVNLNYERLKSRNNLINKNMLNIFPSLTMWWFLICSANFSAPPSLNLISEIFMINSLIQWNKLLIIMIIMISFFSTCYSIFLYSFSQYGKMNFSFFNLKNINCKEYLILTLHYLPLNLMFLNLNILI